MKQSVEKDQRNRNLFFKYESGRKVLKAISCNQNLSNSMRLKANLSLSYLPKNSSPTRVKKRCILTGRGRFILGQFNMSRMMFRQLAREGFIPGLRKSSW